MVTVQRLLKVDGVGLLLGVAAGRAGNCRWQVGVFDRGIGSEENLEALRRRGS
ncbi:MAG: hypothetical protein WAO35_17280 [Terriglobia bacterium]